MLKIIAVDDELDALEEIKDAITLLLPDASLFTFSSAQKALEYIKENEVDIAFLDINMPKINGLMLAKNIKEKNRNTNIVFVTAYNKYAVEAFNIHASGYVVKPFAVKAIKRELDNLRNPVNIPDIGVRIQCFGNFEVFHDGKAVAFSRAKAKEALAYLIDRSGASVSKKELASILWEDDREYNQSLQSQLSMVISDIEKTLKKIGVEEWLIKKRGMYAVDKSKVVCDYYSYEKGDIKAVNAYFGEYMSQYSWAELKTGWLNRIQ